MKRLDTHQTKDFGPLRMVAADLAEVIDTLSSCKEAVFIADDIQYASVAEFVTESKGRTPKIIRFSAREPYSTIELYPRWARLYVATDDLIASGLFFKLVAIISRCERKPRVIYSYWWTFASMWLIQLVFMLPLLKTRDYVVPWLMGANAIWIAWVVYVNLYKFSLVQPLATADPRTFWQRNSDNVVVAIFSALLGAIGGVAATKATDRLWPPASASSPSPTAAPPSAPVAK